MCLILCSVYTMTVFLGLLLHSVDSRRKPDICNYSCMPRVIIDNPEYILQNVWESGTSIQDQLEMPGHSQQWQRPGSLRFDSANSLWTWRAIWPLTSGSDVAGSRSGRPQPQPETDLWPAVGRPPTSNKTDPRTEGSHYTAVALPLVVWSASAVHVQAYARLNDSKTVLLYVPLRRLQNKCPQRNKTDSVDVYTSDCYQVYRLSEFSWTHVSRDMNNVGY